MEVEKTTVSIITPMYNVAEVIQRSFDSVMAQSISDIEYVLVDDCSKDNTLEVLDRLINRATRQDISFKLIRHEVNRGVAAARNTGLDNSSGKYIYFLDADDWLDGTALQEMVELAETYGADVVGCDWKQTFEKTEKTQRQPDVSSPEEAFHLLSNGVMRWNLWLFLIRRELYDGLRFIEMANMGEDMMLVLKMILRANVISQTHEVYYHYLQTNSNSLTKSYMKHKSEMDVNQKSLFDFVSSCRPDLLADMYHLQLALKLPLLISNDRRDYEEWLSWFPESNRYAGCSRYVLKRIRILQAMAAKRQFWFLRTHYWLVTKIIYGILYR